MTEPLQCSYRQLLRRIWDELVDTKDDGAAVRLLISAIAEMEAAFVENKSDTDCAEALSDRRLMYEEILSLTAVYAAGRGILLNEERREMNAKEQSFQQLHQQLLKKNMELRERTMVDELTGLFNRRYFERNLSYDIERFRRYKRPIGVVLFDVDYFKKINDTYGHAAGDAALKHLADLAKATIRSADMVARYGGEEFVLLLPETGSEGSAILAERLRRRVESSFIATEAGELKITISLGVFAIEGNFSGNAEDVMRIVDSALYAAKGAGRNRSIVV